MDSIRLLCAVAICVIGFIGSLTFSLFLIFFVKSQRYLEEQSTRTRSQNRQAVKMSLFYGTYLIMITAVIYPILDIIHIYYAFLGKSVSYYILPYTISICDFIYFFMYFFKSHILIIWNMLQI